MPVPGLSLLGLKRIRGFVSILRYINPTIIIINYKDWKCADNENPSSAHIVLVKLYTYNCILAIPLSDYLPCTGKRGMKNIQLLNEISFSLI